MSLGSCLSMALRKIPIWTAKTLVMTAVPHKPYVAAYIRCVFFIISGILVGVSEVMGWLQHT